MEVSSSSKPVLENLDIPLQLNEGEVIKFIEKNVSFLIKNDDDEKLEFNEGTFVLTTQKVVWLSTKHKKGIFFNYQNAITHGYNKLTLVCLISFENEEDEEPYRGVFEEPQEGNNDIEEEKDNEGDIILNKIQSMNSLVNEEDLIQIVGHYNVDFEFEAKTRSNVLDVFQIFSECSALNPDRNEQPNGVNNLFGLMGLLEGGEQNGEEENDEEDDDDNYLEEEHENGENGNGAGFD